MYEHGEGVPASMTEAAKWYRSGAEQGDSTAQARIGNMYAAGEGVSKDPVEAFAWLDLAAAAGEKTTDKRDEIRQTLTKEQVAKATQMETKVKTGIAENATVGLGLFGQ